MSLIEWSTPERHKGGKILPTIPNEIYICIFEFIVPPTARLTAGDLGIFTNLCGVCRFFANFCLPRLYEFLEFSGSIFRNYTPTELSNDVICKASRGATLCTQIAAKQPLALSLAKSVRSCHFMHWRLDGTGAWGSLLFIKKYLAGMLHMRNIRELKFYRSFVDAEHWSTMATLESLEELSFDGCRFLHGPADVEPEERVKVKVSHLRVINCTGHRQPAAAIQPQYLRTLTMDLLFSEHIDWLPQSDITVLRLCFGEPFDESHRWYFEEVPLLLTRAPPSLSTLWLYVDLRIAVERDMIQNMFADPAWQNLTLRSLILQLLSGNSDRPGNDISFALDCISLLTNLQSVTLKGYPRALEMLPPTEVRRILHDKLSAGSSLTHADIDGDVFRLVDGEWSHAS